MLFRSVQGKIKSFVEAYNKLQQQITALTKYDAENKKASALTGDALVLIRPDGHIGLVAGPGTVEQVAEYWAALHGAPAA